MSEQDIALYSMIADAVYADLSDVGTVFDLIESALLKRDIPSQEVSDFLKTYSLEAASPADSKYGMQAAVFKNIKTGEYFFAVRGTESTSLKDLTEDITRIGPDGVATHQGVELLNWYAKLNAKEGDPVVVFSYESHPVGPDTLSYTVEVSKSNGILFDKSFTSVGHSLGGHLAILLSRFAGAQVTSTYSFNGPGLDFYFFGLNSGWRQKFLIQLQRIKLDLLDDSTIANEFPPGTTNNVMPNEDIKRDFGSFSGSSINRLGESAGPYPAHLIFSAG